MNDIQKVLRETREALLTPEGKDIIQHAKDVINELYSCPIDAHFSPCGNHLKVAPKCNWCLGCNNEEK